MLDCGHKDVDFFVSVSNCCCFAVQIKSACNTITFLSSDLRIWIQASCKRLRKPRTTSQALSPQLSLESSFFPCNATPDNPLYCTCSASRDNAFSLLSYCTYSRQTLPFLIFSCQIIKICVTHTSFFRGHSLPFGWMVDVFFMGVKPWLPHMAGIMFTLKLCTCMQS
jgi:hypothetical protein